MSSEEEEDSSSESGSTESSLDWDWLSSLRPSKGLKESELQVLSKVFEKWRPRLEGEEDEETPRVKEVFLMYELLLGAFRTRDTDLKEALEELRDKGESDEKGSLALENKQLKKLLKKSKNEKNEDEAMEEILQLEQDVSKLKHECSHLERELSQEKSNKETLESRVDDLQRERKSLRKEIDNLKDEIADSRRSLVDDEAEQQEVELKRVRELEESIRLKNKQIHQLLEDIELVEKDNVDYQENVINLRDRLSEATNQINSLTSEYMSSKESSDRLNNLVEGLQSENSRLQILLDDFHSDKKKRDKNLETLGKRVDQKFETLADKLREKDAEIDEYKERLNRLRLEEQEEAEDLGVEEEDGVYSHGKRKVVRENISILSGAIKEREEQIEALRRDLVQATSELDRSAKIIEDLRSKKKSQESGSLQKTVVDMQGQLYEANKRNSELEEDIQEAREIARGKTEELSSCIARLHSFEKGEYGLEQALDEIKGLKERLSSDEQHIHELTTACNRLQYSKSRLEEENNSFRDQLGLSPRVNSSVESGDALILTPKIKANSKDSGNQDKALMQVMQREIERLEEERILLKTENRKLARQIGAKSAQLGLMPEDLKNIQEYTDALRYRRRKGGSEEPEGDSIIQIHKKMNTLENELKEQGNLLAQKEGECTNMNLKYDNMLSENKELRKSMREILDSIKSQDAESNVKIESESLDRILTILDARHLWGEYHPAMELNERIQRLEGCNLELRNQLKKARREEERYAIQISKHVGRIQDLESKLIGTNAEERPTKSIEKNKETSNIGETEPLKPCPSSFEASDMSMKLNSQLIQVIDQLHEKEAFNKNLGLQIEDLHRKINVQRHQMGLLYEEHREKKLSWESEVHKLRGEKVDQNDTIQKLRIKVEEYEKDLESDEAKSDIRKKIIILRSNEAMMIRRYRSLEDNEKKLREEVKRLKEDAFKMENEVIRKLGFLQRYKDMASYKIEALQKSLCQSVHQSELNAMHSQYSELLIKYRSVLQRDPLKDASEDNMDPTLSKEFQNMKNEITSLQDKNISLQSIIESLSEEAGKSSQSPTQMTNQIANLEMRELNERERANCLERQVGTLHIQVSELVDRNKDLEIKLKEMTAMNTKLQQSERDLQDKIIHDMTREDYEALNTRLQEFETLKAELQQERDELKEIADIATNQIHAFESKNKSENIELEALRHQVIDLQTKTDEKSIMGKLHRQIIILQVRENESLQKIKNLETTSSKKEIQLFKINKKCGEYENSLLKIRMESNKKLKEMYKMIQDLRHRYNGSIVPLMKQETMAQNALNVLEVKRKLRTALQKAEEERLAAELLTEELKIKAKDSVATSKEGESLKTLQDLKIREMKASRKMESALREVEHLRKANDLQSQEIDRLEAEVIRKENMFDSKYFSDWEPIDTPNLEVEPEKIVRLHEKKYLNHDEPLAIQLESALKKIKIQTSTNANLHCEISERKKESDELHKRFREMEGLLRMKEKALNELRSQIPNTVDKLIAASTATGPSGFPLALSEDYESRQGLKIAKSTVECLRERLKQKEDILIRYESTIKSNREEAEKGIRRKEEEIHALQSRLRIQQTMNSDLQAQIHTFGTDEKHSFERNFADKRVKEMEDEVASLHRSVAEYSNKCNQLMRDRDKYLELSDNFREKLEELGDRSSSSSEDISILHRMNEEISQLRLELEHAQARENELLKEKMQVETKSKVFPSSKRLEIEERDKKIRSLSKVITDLKSEMLNLKRINPNEKSLLDERYRQICDLTDKNDKLNRTIRHLREKEVNHNKEITKLKDELYEALNSERPFHNQPPEISQVLKERDSLRVKVRHLEQRIETINRPERPLEESPDDHLDEDVFQKRIKTASELARWNESKKWQGKVESLKTKLSEQEAELSKQNRLNKSMKETIARFDRDVTIMKSRLKTATEKSVSYDVKVDDLTELNEELRKENDRLKKLGPVSEPLETLKLKNKFLNDRIESQEQKIAALEITKNKSKAEVDFIAKIAEIQEKEKLCQKEKLDLEEKILNLQMGKDKDVKQKATEIQELKRFLQEVKELMDHCEKEEIHIRIDNYLAGHFDIKPGKSLISRRFQSKEKKLTEEELLKMKEMNEKLIVKVESKNQELSALEERVEKLQRLLKGKEGTKSSSDKASFERNASHDQTSVIELPSSRLQEMESDLKRKSELLNEVKGLLKQAASRERSQTSENESLKKKVELLTQVDPKSPSHILAKELRLCKLTVERLESEKKELEHQIEVLSKN